MGKYHVWNEYNYATNFFNVKPQQHYNIPKPKFLYYVEFNINPFGQKLMSGRNTLEKIGFQVKTLERPNIQYTQKEVNQYNKKRLVTTGVTYGPMTFTFYDTVDEVALKLVKDYNDFYYHDFQRSLVNWDYDNSKNKNNANIFGVNARTSGVDMYFFETIDVYEFYNGYYTKYQLVHPKLEAANFGQNDMEASEGNEVILTLKMEGILYENIAEEMTAEISNKIGLPFQEGTTNNFKLTARRIPGSGLDIDPSDSLFQAPQVLGIGGTGQNGLGNFVRRTLGNIGNSILSNVLLPAAQNFVGQALSQVGATVLQPLANRAIQSGARNVSRAIGGLF